VSLWVAQAVQHDSVYALGLARKGIRLERGRDVEVLETLTVGEVMREEFPTLAEDDTLQAASLMLLHKRHHGLPVMTAAGELAGILTIQDIDRAQAGGRGEARVGEVCTRDLLVAHPDESLGAALRRMSVRDVGRLPVVAREANRRLVGVLRRVDLVRAYDVALSRRAELRHRAHQVRLGAFTGVQVDEYVLAPGAPCVGKPLKDTAWPRESVIASLRRGRQTLIPHGDTVLRPGDVLAVVTAPEARPAVRQLCGFAE
jgi:CIC family chloride channel protein